MRTWILQRFHVYARVALLVGIVLGPTVFSRDTQDVFNLLKFTVIFVTGLAGFLLWIVSAAERGVWVPRFNLLIAAGAFLFACLLSTVFSENKLLSLLGLYHRYGGLLPFIVYALIMVAIVALYWEKPSDLEDVVKASAGATLMLVVYVLIQAAGKDWIPWKDSTGNAPPYPVGTMGNSNFAGGYLGIAIPFVYYLAASAKNEIYKILFYCLLALDVLALWFTQTRGGMLAALVAGFAMVFAARKAVPKWVKVSAVAAFILGLILAVMVLWHPGFDKPPGPLGRVETFRTGTFSVRTFYWRTAIRIFLEEPVVGAGLERYFARYPEFRLPEDGAQLGLTITDKPHNIFLEYLANAGILGAGTYVVFLGLAVWYGLRRMDALEGRDRLLLQAFIGVVAGYAAQGFVSIDVPPLAVMSWIGVAGIAAFSDPVLIREREEIEAAARRQPKPGRKKQRRQAPVERVRIARQGGLRTPVHLSVMVVFIGSMLIGVRPLLADAAARKGAIHQATEGQEAQAKRKLLRAIELHPLEAHYRSQAGSLVEAMALKEEDQQQKVKLLQEALRFYREALRLQDGNVFYMMNIARVEATWGAIDRSHYKESDKWWKAVVEKDPTDWDVHNRYAIMLNEYANAFGGDSEIRKRSAAELEIVVKIKPDFVPAWLNLAKVYAALGDTPRARKAADRALVLEPGNQEAIQLSADLASEPVT